MYQGSPHVRGNVIEIPLYCESGCTFRLLIGFHKGNTNFWTQDHKTGEWADPSEDDN